MIINTFHIPTSINLNDDRNKSIISLMEDAFVNYKKNAISQDNPNYKNGLIREPLPQVQVLKEVNKN